MGQKWKNLNIYLEPTEPYDVPAARMFGGMRRRCLKSTGSRYEVAGKALVARSCYSAMVKS
jgi:hypothetical protein